jgi:hypothetical protein
MATAVQNIKDGYANNSAANSAMNGKIVAIYITNETANCHYKTDKNLEVKFDKTYAQMGSLLVSISNGNYTPGFTAMLRHENAVKMAAIADAPHEQSQVRFRFRNARAGLI